MGQPGGAVGLDASVIASRQRPRQRRVIDMASELYGITTGRTDQDGSAGIGFDARRVLNHRRQTTDES